MSRLGEQNCARSRRRFAIVSVNEWDFIFMPIPLNRKDSYGFVRDFSALYSLGALDRPQKII